LAEKEGHSPLTSPQIKEGMTIDKSASQDLSAKDQSERFKAAHLAALSHQ
jgi:hypothetical protein